MVRTIPPVLRLLILPGLLVVVALYIAPLVLMLSLAFREPQPGLTNAQWIAESAAVHTIAWATLRFGAIASAISVCLGFIVAYVIWLSRPWISQTLLAIVLASFWLSVLIRCFSLILILGPRGPVNGIFSLIGIGNIHMIRNPAGVLLGMAHYLIPFAVLTILVSLRSIDLNVVAAARSMGASHFHIFHRVLLPLAAPGLVASFSLCFVISLGFYITPALLGGGRVVMIAEFITFFVQNVLDWGKASMLAIALLVVILASFGLLRLVQILLRRQSGEWA